MTGKMRTWGRSGLVLALSGWLMCSTCPAQIRLTGVNLAGAEFGPHPTPGNLGNYGLNADYFYPTAAEVDYYVGKGMNTFRLPFRWERLQHSQNAALDATELSRMDAFVNYATSHGANVIIDPHNFQRYYPDPNNFQQSAQGLVGTDVPDSAFADFWSRLANEYKDDNHVFFNLMNEPTTLPTEQLVTSENAAIAAIRATGAKNLILVPGNAYTGAWQWTANWYGTPNASAMLNIVDPGNNYAFDVHQYFDSDGSGTHSTIDGNNTNTGVSRLTAFTNWLHDHDLKGFLGEFAVANSIVGNGGTQIGDETVKKMLDYVEANDDVWLGWNWWASGPKWGNYMFTLEPTNLGQSNQGADRAAMAVLQPYFADNLPGDFNFDGTVDAADYTVWRDALGQTGVAQHADSNFDGVVDELDYAAWQAHFGESLSGAGSASRAVPEPAAGALLLLAGTMVALTARPGRPLRRHR
jgi:endoglucanase